MMQVFFNSDGTSVTAIITIIVDGVHTDPDSWPITDDPAIVLSTHPSAVKTVTSIDTGVFKVVWTGLSPALTHGETFFIAIDGLISTVAWTTWQMPFQCVLLPSTVTALAVVETSTTTTIPALIPTAGAIADQVWDEATAGHTTAGTYGGRVVRSTNSNVEVQITGSNHIAADVHEFQTGVITAADFATDAITAAALAADAVTEIQSGLASQASVDVIDGIVDTILVDTNDLQLNQGAWLTASGFSTHSAADVWAVTTRALTDKAGFALSSTGLAAISTWTVDVTGSLSGNVGGIAGTITTLDALDTAQDTQHGTTRTEVAKIPKTGDTNTYTQVSSDSGTKSAIVTIS
jgi:hypothetical protein